MSKNQKSFSFARLAKNPWICIFSMILGVIVGGKFPDIGRSLVFPGKTYLVLLKMSVLPIIPTAIISGLAKLLRSDIGSKPLIKLAMVFIVAVIMGSALGMAAGFIWEPGKDLGSAASALIGETLQAENLTSSESSGGLAWIITSMIPENVFSVMVSGNVLGIIFVSILIGAGTGRSKKQEAEFFLNSIAGIYDVFVKILGWMLLALPFGLFCLLAGQAATMGIDSILALGKFVMVFYIACFIQAIIFLIAMRLSTGKSFFTIIGAVRDPLILAFSAASSIPPVPIALNNMEKKLKQPREILDLVIPMGVAMNRQSYAMLFSLTAVFSAQLYGIALTVPQCINIILASSLIGMATVGRSAAIAPLMAGILAPVNIPVSIAIAVFGITGPILDPVVQTNILFGACASSTMISSGSISKDQNSEEDDSEDD